MHRAIVLSSLEKLKLCVCTPESKQQGKNWHLTFQLQANEVSIPQVFQEDTVGRAGLEIERDVSTGLTLEGGKVQIG